MPNPSTTESVNVAENPAEPQALPPAADALPLCGHQHGHHQPALRESFTTEQDWNAYTEENHQVWRLLVRRRMGHLRLSASRAFLDGMQAIGLDENSVPDLALLNPRLRSRTGWQAVPVKGFLEPSLFFQELAARRFPTTVIVRSLSQVDYLPEPDIFHDVFGHVPLHADPVFADFLQRFGALAAQARTAAEVERFTRLFWFTVEFGLIREGGEVKVYGSGLISSHADCTNALGRFCERRPFTLDAVLSQDFQIDTLQPVLFVVDSFEQLFAALDAMEPGKVAS
jgi:phenylalanine-4-hydroxylase